MKKRVFVPLFILIMFFSCRKPGDEQFFIQNDSDYPAEVTTYYLGDTIFYASMAPGEMVSVPQNPNSVENFDRKVLISSEDTDSTILKFGSIKKLNFGIVGFASAYEIISCDKPKRELGCIRIFYVTNDHYAEADSI